jgi:hypothetical protein
MATKAFRFSQVVTFKDELYVKLDDVVEFFDYLAVQNPQFAAGFLHLRNMVRDSYRCEEN